MDERCLKERNKLFINEDRVSYFQKIVEDILDLCQQIQQRSFSFIKFLNSTCIVMVEAYLETVVVITEFLKVVSVKGDQCRMDHSTFLNYKGSRFNYEVAMSEF
jgi:hypothetical protein